MFTDYDKLNAGEVVSKLTDLRQVQLAEVIAYERANRKRTTVIEKAQSLQENEPFPGYDDLTARDVAQRVRDADEATAQRGCASTRGATSAASRSSRAPGGSSADRRHDRRRPRDPRPAGPDRAVVPTRPPARGPRPGARGAGHAGRPGGPGAGRPGARRTRTGLDVPPPNEG